jgi:hypothetical protein
MVYNSYVFIVKVTGMFKVPVRDNQKTMRGTDLNKTPSKQHNLITRSPVKTRRDRSSGYSKSPMRKKHSKPALAA